MKNSAAIVLAILICAAFTGSTICPSGSAHAETPATAPATPTPEVIADFEHPIPGVHSMVGFLHGCSETAPSDDRLLPLRPALWRIGFMWRSNRERVAKLNIPIILVLSDQWQPRALTAIADWDDYIHTTIKQAENRPYTWDVYNEPDLPMFFKGTPAQFEQMYVDAEQILHKELGPAALVSGPSIHVYNPDYIAAFLDYCAAHHSRVDVLSWHELDDDNNTHAVTEHLLDARKRFIDNPAYQSLGIKRIEINEIVGSSAQYFPGEILGYFDALEKGGADGACKGCWHDSKGKSNCSNNSLDGIVTPDTGTPRAAWWAYKAYSDTVATRVASLSSDPALISFAASGDKTSAAVLLGCVHAEQTGNTPRLVHLHLTGLNLLPFVQADHAIHIRVEHIPNSGEIGIDKLDITSEQDLAVEQGTAALTLPAIAEHEAELITLTKMTR